MKQFFLFFIFFMILYCPASQVFANDLSGEVIMGNVFNREDGKDRYVQTEMVLIDKKGNQRKRLLEMYTKDYGKIIKTFLRFTAPADIAGTSFLSLENANKEDTQYLYLPDLGRERRIVSSQKKARFVNTDFSYEDMRRRHPDKDEHKILRKEIFQGYKCYVIGSFPREGDSQYSKRIHWVDKDRWIILRTDFYGKKGKKIKEFRVGNLQNKQNIWTAMDTVMEDLKGRHQTIMKIIQVHYNQNLEDIIFNVRHMKVD